MNVRRALPILFICLVLAILGAPRLSAADREAGLVEHLPRDPIFVWTVTVDDFRETLDGLLQVADRLETDVRLSMVDEVERYDATLGCSLRDDLLARLGPEVAFVIDLPDVDSLMATLGSPETGVPALLGKMALVARVHEPLMLGPCLRNLFATIDLTEVDHEDGLVRLSARQVAAHEPGALDLYYGLTDDTFAIGLSPEVVRGSLRPREPGERLSDGADFISVLSQLDATPQTLTYVNLPRLRDMVATSQTLQPLIDADPQTRAVVDWLMSAEFSGMGIGSSTVAVDGGMRRTSFGPSGLTGGALPAGILASVAVPNFLNATDRGRQKRTMADLRSIGTACESFSIDENRYPGPTEGWVEVGEIAADVEPVYIRVLPRVDGWGNPLMYWSDGEAYRIVSAGRDGETERDWRDAPGGPTYRFESDIVFGDGQFSSWPEGIQR